MWTELQLNDGTITLRCMQRADVGAHYLAWLHDPEVNQYLEVRHTLPSDEESLWQFVDGVNRSADSLMLGIFGPEGRHIGNIKIGPVHAIHQRAEVGIICGERSQWGKGYATRAIRLASHHAFAEMGVKRLTAGCYDTNLGSMRAFIKAGYVHEGTLANYWQCNGQSVGQILMGLSAPLTDTQARSLVFIGGGQLMLDTMQAARRRGLNVGALLADRHAQETLATGHTLADVLHTLQIPASVMTTASAVDPALLGAGFQDSTALCFGPAWVFPPEVLARFPGGMLNFNGIPIPHYLGGAHYTWQILNGHRKAGCHIQRITSQVDRGGLIMSEAFDLPEDVQTPADYFRENDRLGMAFLNRFLDQYVSGAPFSARAFSEVNEQRLYFPRLLTLENGWIDWSWSGADIQAFCRAFAAPYKGASTCCNGRRIRLTQTQLLAEPDDQHFHPFCTGLIVRKTDAGVFVAVSGGLLQVLAFEWDGSEPGPTLREGDRLFTEAAMLAHARLHRPRLAGTTP